MIYTLINPSDGYTFEAPSLDIATMATLLVGRGKYAAEPIEGGEPVPLMLFGIPELWFSEQFGEESEAFAARMLKEKRSEIADCLESFLIGDERDRQLYMHELERLEDEKSRKQLRNTWHDKRRSSMNNIGSAAWKIAAALREPAAVT